MAWCASQHPLAAIFLVKLSGQRPVFRACACSVVWVVALALAVPVVLMALLAVQVVEWAGKRTLGDSICEEMEELAHSAGDKLLLSTVATADD